LDGAGHERREQLGVSGVNSGDGELRRWNCRRARRGSETFYRRLPHVLKRPAGGERFGRRVGARAAACRWAAQDGSGAARGHATRAGRGCQGRSGRVWPRHARLGTHGQAWRTHTPRRPGCHAAACERAGAPDAGARRDVAQSKLVYPYLTTSVSKYLNRSAPKGE
jgi:hypothetical protein